MSTDESRAAEIRAIRNRMDLALAESDRGEGVDGDEFMRELVARLDRSQTAPHQK